MRDHERRGHEGGELQAVLPLPSRTGGKVRIAGATTSAPSASPSHQSNHNGAKRCHD